MQVAPTQSIWEVNAMQQIQRPPSQVIPDEGVVSDPTCGPAVGFIPAHPPLNDCDEECFDLIKNRLTAETHGATVPPGQTLPDAALGKS
ncbi:hypothetical protein GCM10027610_039710 [Dactylosporangium cerinum]